MKNVTELLFEAWNFRHACKEFDPTRPVSDADFHTILEAGRLSPSSLGFEPWEFLVLQNKELREKLRAVTWGGQGQLPTASHVIMILARKPQAMTPDCAYIRTTIMEETQRLPPDVAQARADKYCDFLQNDFAYADNERARFEWAARQCYIALGNMMTAAALLRIDSCPMEGFQKEPVEQILEAAGLLNRAAYGAACMVAFGYRVKEPRPKTRRPLEQVVRWAL